MILTQFQPFHFKSCLAFVRILNGQNVEIRFIEKYIKNFTKELLNIWLDFYSKVSLKLF